MIYGSYRKVLPFVCSSRRVAYSEHGLHIAHRSKEFFEADDTEVSERSTNVQHVGHRLYLDIHLLDASEDAPAERRR